MADNQDELISQFVEVTGASPADAQQYLAANEWDIGGATTEYFTALEEGDEDDEMTNAQQPGASVAPEPYTGPRTLDGRPAPESALPAASSSRSAPPSKRGGIATLGSLGSSSQGHGHAHDDDDDSDDDDEADQPRDLFAGGEKSGLAVQDPSKRSDPRKVVNDILKKARANAKRVGGEDSEAAPSRFRGTGQTLGDESTPSQPVPDPTARAPSSPPVTRILHIWEEGFSIEDGELRRFDDPRNARDLQMIQSGRAPLHLMGVRPDQAVDVQLIKHNEKYKAPPKVYKPFSGGGNRLGSPTPGGSSTVEEPSPVAAAPSVATPAAPEPTIDASQPTVSLRVQLADGTRLPARFNTTSTVGDVYDFITRAAPGVQRAWVLATTFPNKDHTDKTLQLGDVAEFKRGGTAVQKWT